MKSWSRNVKKWILFLKITGILVILCMIAGACILYAAENHIQLLKNNLSNEVWESGCEWVWQQIFPLSMDLTGKHSNQTLQTQKKWSSINTMDPAYDQYEKALSSIRLSGMVLLGTVMNQVETGAGSYGRYYKKYEYK